MTFDKKTRQHLSITGESCVYASLKAATFGYFALLAVSVRSKGMRLIGVGKRILSLLAYVWPIEKLQNLLCHLKV
jgi:hypothetical protein